MKILFMGTPDFAVPCLEKLINAGHDVCGVFTQPDKPKGRKQLLTFTPIKEVALENGIKVFQPSKLRSPEVMDIIKTLNPEIIIVVAYGKILPKEIIDYPKYGCVNVHASLLPKYRGAGPIQWSVINGEKITGVTTMYMDEGLDTGDMLLKSEVEISENETTGELHDKLAVVGSNLILKTIDGIISGTIKREKQCDIKSSYAPMLDKSLCSIDWSKNNTEIHNLVRGLNPWPVASTVLDGKILKIYKTSLSDVCGKNPGEVIKINPFVVSCGDNTSLEILEVQLQGKKKMTIDDFVRGHKIEIGKIFGE